MKMALKFLKANTKIFFLVYRAAFQPVTEENVKRAQKRFVHYNVIQKNTRKDFAKNKIKIRLKGFF